MHTLRMPQRIFQSCREWIARLHRALPGLWQESLPALPRCGQGVQIPLRPSPLARKGRWLLHALQGAYLLQLVLLGHLSVAAIVLLISAASAWQCRPGRSSSAAARRLLLSADGRMHLLGSGHRLAAATLQPYSMRLGPWLLLVLRDDSGTRRLLLGPDNVDPVELAALRRRLAAITHRLGGTR